VDENGTAHGWGVMKYVNGDITEGGWKEGKEHGKGIVKFRNGEMFEGQWKDGLASGEGKYTFANGDICVEEWINGKKIEPGTMIYQGGDVYVGQFKENSALKHGDGKYTFENGNVYLGSFQNGKIHGIGELKYASGCVYKGSFENEQMCEGELIDCEGNKYEGNWKNNEKHGAFVMTDASGNKYKQAYDDGTLKSSKQCVSLESIAGIEQHSQRRQIGATAATNLILLGSENDINECSICCNEFSTDMETLDDDIKKLLPVFGTCNCTSVFCHGCVLKLKMPGSIPGWSKCPNCRKDNAFCPSEPNYDRRLIGLLSRCIPVA